MPYFTTTDGTELHYTDQGTGQPVIFSHGWPLSADAWQVEIKLLADNGYRAIAHDRRGHGHSAKTYAGNDMDTYAKDLAELVEHLDLTNLVVVGHSTGGGEVVRYAAQHGKGRVAKVITVGAVPPQMVKSDSNPDGLPIEVFDGIRAGSLADRSQLYRDLADGPFFGNNREGVEISEGTRAAFWRQGLQSGHKNAYDSIAAFSATDMRPDLDRVDVPTLVIHGDDDQVVPFPVGGQASAARIAGARLKVYPGGPHGLTDTHKDELSADLLAFARGEAVGELAGTEAAVAS